jgi:hypothetical protein
MKLNFAWVLSVACWLGACGDDGGSAIDGGLDAGSGGAFGDRDGSVDEIDDAPPGSTTTSLDGVWVVTGSPAQLLRYPDGATQPADTIELDWDAEYLEIVDGVAFYLGRSIVSGGETLHAQDLRTGERTDIVFSAESALTGLVFADGSLWVGDQALDAVWRVNPTTQSVVGGTLLETYDDDQNDGLELAASADSVYVSSFFGSSAVLRISTATGVVEARQDEGGDGTTGVAVGEGAAWAVSRFDGTLWRYDASDLTSREMVALEADISRMTRNAVTGFGAVWVLAGTGGNAQDIFGQEAKPGVFRVDATTLAPVTHIPLDEPRGLRATDDALWIATTAAALRIDPTNNGVVRTLTPASGEVVDVAFARSGGGTGSTAGLSAIDVYTVVEPPPTVCEDLGAFYNHGTLPVYEAASATLTIEGGTNETFDQGTCQTLRNAAGEVVEYLAYFADALDEPSKSARVTISGYAGDGTYDAILSWEGASGGGVGGATAVISNGGLHGVVTSAFDDDVLELDCAADAAVGLEVEPMTEPAPGEVVVQNEEGVVFRFINMDCGADILSESLWVTAPEYFVGFSDSYAFDLRTQDPAEQGTLPGSLSFAFFGSGYVASEGIDVVLTCGSPVTGTFSGSGFTGSFTCP